MWHRLTPDVLWAQRSDTVLLTVNLSDIKNEKLSLEENMFSFSGNAGVEKKLYTLQMTFHKEVVPQVRVQGWGMGRRGWGCDNDGAHLLNECHTYHSHSNSVFEHCDVRKWC